MQRVLRAAAGRGRRFSGAIDCDYVIVGGGTAGCVLANRLSADPTKKVVLLEAGGEDDWVWHKIPVGYLFTMMSERSDWRLSTVPQEHLNGRVIAMPRGKVLGGCSSINGTIYMRGQRADYEAWGAVAPGWDWDSVLPYFKKSMDYHLGADELHGTGGEWKVQSPRVRWDILDTFQAAAEECGMPLQKHFNNSDSPGCGYFQVNHDRGVRVSASTAFLRPVRHRANLTVLKYATAQRILFADGGDKLRAEGVAFRQRGGAEGVVRAAREVVLSSGAIHTPLLLEVSGVGRREVLEAAGVRCARDVRGVGESLRDHLQIRPVYKLKKGTRTLNQLSHNPFSLAWMGLEYLFFQSGPMAMAPSTFGAVCRSDIDVDTPDLEFHLQPLSCDKLELGALHRFPGMTVSVCNLRPTSAGSTHLTGPTLDAAPAIDPKYLSTAEDKETAVRGVRWARRLMQTTAMRGLCPQEYLPGAEVETAESIVESAGRMASSIFHPVSTCRMGSDDDDGAVVDAQLRLRCASNVRIADASVMPTITSGNTCSPVVMIAEKAADIIRSAGSASAA